MEAEIKAVVIRMPIDLHRAIKTKAAAEERSMAQAIRHALRIYLETGDERRALPADRSEESP